MKITGRMATFLAALWMVWSAQAAEVRPCDRRDGLMALCGLQSPEDMERLPGGKSLLVSQIKLGLGPQGMTWAPGSLAELHLASGRLRVLYPNGHAKVATAAGAWGDPGCSGEIGADLSPHGIHLSRRGDGAWQLLVVNHGRRESVEFFEWRRNGELRWRGCAQAPEGSLLNDAAALPDGGLVVSTMITEGPASFNAAMERARAGENTGHVWRWSRDGGFRKVPGSEGPMPNGVAVDAAGKYLFLSAGGVRKIDLESGAVLGTAPFANPDNLSWDGPHRLLVAGIAGRPAIGDYNGQRAASSLGGIEVAAVDADTLAVVPLLSHDGSLLGGASVALRVARNIYVGSFTGNRLLIFPAARRECGAGS